MSLHEKKNIFAALLFPITHLNFIKERSLSYNATKIFFTFVFTLTTLHTSHAVYFEARRTGQHDQIGETNAWWMGG